MCIVRYAHTVPEGPAGALPIPLRHWLEPRVSYHNGAPRRPGAGWGPITAQDIPQRYRRHEHTSQQQATTISDARLRRKPNPDRCFVVDTCVDEASGASSTEVRERIRSGGALGELLALFDAVRGGSAREQALALALLEERLQP